MSHPRSAHRRRSLAVVGVLLTALPLGAGWPPSREGGEVRTTLEEADSAYWAGEPDRSLALLEDFVRTDPDHYEARWKASRAAVSVALLGENRDGQRETFDRGVAHGSEAARIEPNGVDGLYWLSVAIGRRSFLLSARGSARAGQEVYDLSHRILGLDPMNAGAHDALGMLAYRVMRLSGFERFVARTLLGNPALESASLEIAEQHLKRAVELDPSWLVPHLDLGRTYLYTDRLDLAEAELQRAIELPLRHPGDRKFRQEALDALGYARSLTKR